MGRPFNPDKIRRFYMNEKTRKDLLRDLQESIESKAIDYRDLSIRDLFESVVPAGPELLRAMSYRKSGGRTVRDILEAGGGEAVNTGDFANITGQIVYNKIRDAYQFPDALWPELCETMRSDFLYGERIPGIGGIGASAIEVVGEGEEFPLLGVNEEYVDAPAMNKRGFIVAVTREMIIMDRTGLLLERCGAGGTFVGINKEYRVLGVATGQVNNYNRNGVASNTYLTSGAYINRLSSNPLTDWTSIEAQELLFDGITDPNTGLPIILPAAQLLVPNALKRTANRIMMASEVAHVDNQPNARTVRQMYPNPMEQGFYGNPKYKVLANAYVKAVSGSATQWYFGNFKKAILYREAWAQETLQAMDNNEQQFTRDIWLRFKVSECGSAFSYEPRHISLGNG